MSLTGIARVLALALTVVGAAHAQVWTETVLHNFLNGPLTGANPGGGLERNASGNFYGTAGSGGASDEGIVFKIDPSGHETVLYNFTGANAEDQPFPGVVRDSSGNFYGTTPGDGIETFGEVYVISPAGQLTVLYTFKGGADGSSPGCRGWLQSLRRSDCR